MAVQMIKKAGLEAVRSSVHVNFGPPMFDKLSACSALVRSVLKGDPTQLDSYVYVGDALNDAPMFKGFRAVGRSRTSSSGGTSWRSSRRS